MAIPMKDPLVSVKMITYNHASYIAQSIECVLQQKANFPFELVIGEDCSTDGTREIVFKYQNKYPNIIRVITSDKNVGARINTIRTFKYCRGKYIAFCEGDDYWHNSHKLQKQVDYLESHPECGLLFADCHIHHVEFNKLYKNVNFNNGYQSPVNLTIEQIITQRPKVWTCTAMARRNLIKKVSDGDPYLYQGENFLMGDNQLWAELSLLSKVRYIPESMGTYRRLVDSASHRKDLNQLLRFLKSSRDMKIYICDKYKLSEDLRREIESRYWDNALRIAFHQRNTELALEIKREKKIFSWEEWLRYYGARNSLLYFICHYSALFLNLFRKNDNLSLK